VTTVDAAATVQSYVAAWNTQDDTVRRRLLEQSLSSTGRYTDPLVDLEGRAAVARHAAAFAQRWPGAIIVVSRPMEPHNGMVCFGWRVVGAGGETLREGIDFGELAEDGRLRRVVGFFDPSVPASVPASGPASDPPAPVPTTGPPAS